MYKLKVKLILIFFSILLGISSFAANPTFATSPFKDISSTDKEILYLWNKGLIQGVSSTSFGPQEPITREQAATLIGRALKLNGTPRKTKFTDINPKRYSSGYIQSAVEKGIITGFPNGTFRPSDTMTRGEMAFLLSRAFNLTKTGPVFFNDISADLKSESLYTAVNKIATAGISNGVGNGLYAPNKDLIRRDFAVFLARSLNQEFKVTFQNVLIGKMSVTTDNLNVRTGPSTSSTIIGKVHTGTPVEIYGYIGEWAYGKAGTFKGYLSLAYLSTSSVSSSKRIIAIDAGHGGSDSGAIANGLKEKDINLDVSKRVQRLLTSKGIKVLMTRSTDVFYSLDYRASYGSKNGADTFVSIHTNSASPAASGSETYYSAALDKRAADSKQLASFIQNRLYKVMEHNNRGVKEAPFRVINANVLPAALVELGFVTNSSDANKLASNIYKERAATAIAEGIEDYYEWKEKN